MSMPSSPIMTTMPSRHYVDPAVYELDKERVFYRTWQFVGHVSSLPASGAFFTARIADESLIVVRNMMMNYTRITTSAVIVHTGSSKVAALVSTSYVLTTLGATT